MVAGRVVGFEAMWVVFNWPWCLASLAVVVAAAVVALRRPLQRVVPVSSLRLWEKALAALGPSASRRARRLTAAWVALLAGAVLAGVALSRPVLLGHRPARRISLALCPTAELGRVGREAMVRSARRLLGRLGPADRVRLLLPAVLGGATEPLSPAEAARRIERLPLLPALAGDLELPPADRAGEYLFRFVPATRAPVAGPRVSTIALPALPAEVTIDAFGAEPLPDGSVQLFVALRNHTQGARTGAVLVGRDEGRPLRLAYRLGPGKRTGLQVKLPAGAYCWAAIEGGTGPASAAFAVRRDSPLRTVAMVGRDDPLVRRFVQVSPSLRLVASPERADVVVAVGRSPPAGKPALVIDPPDPPPGWAAGDVREALALADAGVLSDHPVMAHVDLASVAVRRVRTWRAVGPPPAEKVLLGLDGEALILAARRPRRVYVAFDLTAENTNFGLSESFVIFMANVMEYLVPSARRSVSYDYLTPMKAGPASDWEPVRLAGTGPGALGSGPLPWPGLYRDAAGAYHAVSLLGLTSARPDVEAVEVAGRIPLPPPRPSRRGRELWPVLVCLAAALWLAGWALRAR